METLSLKNMLDEIFAGLLSFTEDECFIKKVKESFRARTVSPEAFFAYRIIFCCYEIFHFFGIGNL